LEALLVYLLIVATVGAIAVVPSLLGRPRRPNGPPVQDAVPADGLEDLSPVGSSQPRLAEVD
jgi:hypothetical protein